VSDARGFADVAVGDEFETAARTITEADLVNFAGVSGDFNDLHLDAETMADSAYGERIAQGALVFSVATGLIWQADVTGDALVAFYGVDRLRFRAPVFVGDTLHVELRVAETERRPDADDATGVVRFETEVVKADGEVALSCELLSLLR
jgi:3-hydroxybutyryl-CoA dehydratase